MRNDPHIQHGFAHEFVTCACTQDEMFVHKACCMPPNKTIGTFGKRWATPLTGFIAGAMAASIMLVPGLIYLSVLLEIKG